MIQKAGEKRGSSNPATMSDMEIFFLILNDRIYGPLLRREPREYCRSQDVTIRTMNWIWKDIAHIEAIIKTARQELIQLDKWRYV